MTVGDERTHAERLGQVESLSVVAFCERALRGCPSRCDLAEEPQAVSLLSALLVFVTLREGNVGEFLRLLQIPVQQFCPSQREVTTRGMSQHPCAGSFHGLHQERHRIFEASIQAVRRPKRRSDPGIQMWDIGLATRKEGSFKERHGLDQVALKKMQSTHSLQRP